jgi:hypothetical protein
MKRLFPPFAFLFQSLLSRVVYLMFAGIAAGPDRTDWMQP